MGRADLFAPGDVLDGRYRVVRLLGKGGSGEVYEAEDRSEGRLVAVKTVLRDMVSSTKLARRFEREVELSRRISHPGVLQIQELLRVPVEPSVLGGGQPVEVPAMVMELLSGETLADRLIRGETVSPEQARPLVCQMAAALAAAHRSGVVHRDLKPDNVFLVPVGEAGTRVVLTDFGVARRTVPAPDDDALTASDVLPGTPFYMAPEQLDLEEAMPASDIYSLGLVIFEMLTGRRPFEARTPIATIFKRMEEDPPSPRIYLPELDRRWEELILCCLERDPKDRFDDPQEIILRLEGETSEWLVEERSGTWWKILLLAALLAAIAAGVIVRL